jgi:hypothetical protein
METMHFRLALATFVALSSTLAISQDASAPAESASMPSSGIGFGSVGQALEELKKRPGVSINITKPDAWTIISEPGGMSQWSFTPASHYAYPAVVNRLLKVDKAGDLSVQMRGLCEAEKGACDKLMKEFEDLNAQMRERVQNRLKNQSGKQ